MKINNQAGQASRLLLVLAVVVLVAVVIVYLVMKMAEKPPAPAPTPGEEIILPVYEQTLNDIRFVYVTAIDRGSVLKSSEIINSQFNSAYQKDLIINNLGAKFIAVTIGAQNVGTANIGQNTWDIENIVDSQGREFVPLEGYTVNPWLPYPNLCGTLLKPAFDPTPCTKIYEVSKVSTGLKIRVQSSKSTSSSKKDSTLIDLIVK